jgi:atrophin-1 interacting protein 5 (WW domain-containing E3 ubiquitin protein ligase 1)
VYVYVIGDFSSLVTPHSHLHFRLLDHNAFRKDAVVGEKRLSLYEVLTHYNGKCENLELTLDLMSESKHDTQPVKVGELITLLNGLKIEMNSCQQVQGTADGHLRIGGAAPTPLGTVCIRFITHRLMKSVNKYYGVLF